jgi:hypothetical protein
MRGSGTISTTTEIPGYDGPHPAPEDPYMLRVYADGRAGGSDVYLQLGDGTTDDAIPADVWFRFWFFINHSADELSGVENRHKFLYPTNDAYPSHTCRWLTSMSAGSYLPHWEQPFGDPTGGEAYVIQRDNCVGTIAYEPSMWPDDYWKLGHTDASGHLAPNRWQLLTIHYDTSDATSGKFEVWIRPFGAETTKVAEWIGGTTPGFSWTVPSPGGHRSLRLFTTIGWTDSDQNDAYYYLKHFAMATSESDLPSYP